jgi:two-component system, NtrC family, sensor kinase
MRRGHSPPSSRDDVVTAWIPAAARRPSARLAAPRLFHGGRLFFKYVGLFVAVVSLALLTNGLLEVWFYYHDHKASLIRIQREQAEAAAGKISSFVKEIESQLGWTTQMAIGTFCRQY